MTGETCWSYIICSPLHPSFLDLAHLFQSFATSVPKGAGQFCPFACLITVGGLCADNCKQAASMVRQSNMCAVCKQGLKACSMIYGSTTPLQSLTELSDMGYHLVFRPLSGKLLSGLGR